VIELQAGDACYSWSLPPPKRLGGVISVEARKKLVRCSGEELCEGHYARSVGAAKATLVERDANGDKWSGRVKC
jgi:hypothetical protein